MGERLGRLSFQTTTPGGIWFHAVSVGEALSAVELIRRVRARWPQTGIYVSTTTLAGRATAEQQLSGLADAIFFAPLDYRSAVRAALRRLRPSAVVILETEIWPNLYREAKRAGASLLVVNGRISDRALPRYQALRGFFRHVLRQPDAIFVQSEEDAKRYVAAGAPPDRVHAAGNLKYDFTPPPAGAAPDLARFLDSLPPGPIWIAASTMPPQHAADPDEDDAVIGAFAALQPQFPDLLLLLAPRRPERFETAAEKLRRAGIRFTRRTSLEPLARPAVLLLDSIGELAALFERASVVFMGGTLACRGGHNILEPAYFARPVIAGPHMENFAAIAAEFSACGAMVRIGCAADLAPAVAALLRDPARAAALGAKARELAQARRGTVDRIASGILSACENGLPDPGRTLAARLALTPLSWLWRAGQAIAAARKRARRRSLHIKVVSIGSLTMGGAGKTPVVAHLAARLAGAGRNPAILTRGYRRESGDLVLVPRGQTAPVRRTGDEAQTFIRAGHAHLGIAGDRYTAGLALEQKLAPGIFLLDDGFQHVHLARDEDIVLLDALDPLAGGLFPLGRCREPLASLARATAILVTRAEPGRGIAGLERLIRRYNPHAPVFRSRIVPKRWVGAGSLAPGSKCGAFCALGDPTSFWRTLDALGLQVAFRRAFGDHHPYRPSELRSLAAQASAAGAEALVTTEKDMMNLPEGGEALLAPHKLFWLEIGVEIENEDSLLRRLL